METNSNLSERIAKRIAASGICSRRDAEKFILDKRVKVNGTIIQKPNLNVLILNLIDLPELLFLN